ncbi:hypothetical protein [Alkalilimnicola ehrlichii]|uniref:Outer membrane protein beta-barrel domain-containing protein n=1 Tax=Alkalilimnicola ehrlichii TaxID=351052 RepID=A0A3E0WZW4_9GAMM|nr:hypothetical protein [Alkalilimnicola ehrlichii]RFA37437.1 hypothetical protein CAL65_09120 [Alkalilimnicola ehrlichii]
MKLISALVLSGSLALAATAQAAQPKEGDFSLAFNPFDSAAGAGFGLSVPSAAAPSYAAGYFVSDTLMPYGFFSLADDDVGDDTVLAIGGGVRVYSDELSSRIRPFLGGGFGIINADDTGFTMGAFLVPRP